MDEKEDQMPERDDEIDVDALLEGLEKPEAERQEAKPEGEPPPEPVWNGEEWAFEVNGRRIIPDSRDKITQWMSQGFNYAQRAGELNKQRSDWEKKLADYESKIKGYSRYDEIDAYARQNPEWWSHVEDAWQKRQTPAVDPAIAPALQPLQEKLGKLEEFISSLQSEREQQQVRQADEALESEISEIRKAYPNIDLSSLDESGKPLEVRVLEHAKEIGTTSFRAAFRDYLFDKLQTLGSANARESAVKARETQARKGVIGQSPTPKAKSPAPYVKGKSYQQLTDEILQEYGIS